MRRKRSDRPPEGTPEFKEWLKARAKKHMDDMFGGNYQPAQFDERGPIFGDIDNLDKTDAELFPSELEEYTPEERRKLLKLHKGDKKK